MGKNAKGCPRSQHSEKQTQLSVFPATEHHLLVQLLAVQNGPRSHLVPFLSVCVFMPVHLAAGTTVVAAIAVVPLLCGTGAAGGKDAPREPAPASGGSVSQEGF